jgi:membrane protease YdiL (CAAX protease family)
MLDQRSSNSRIPNLLHALVFLALTFFAFLFSAFTLLALARLFPSFAARSTTLEQPMAYLIALILASLTFPLLWQVDFLTGIHWNRSKATLRMAGLGLAIGLAGQAVTVFLPHPKDLPIEEVFRNPATIWFLAFFGVVVGPLFEEIVFRGFLLPAIALAIDYGRVPTDPDPLIALDHLEVWRASSTFSTLALVASSILTSLLFALLHAPQLGWTLPAVLLLASVSIILCIVRIRTGSVAASTLVHNCYNLSVFLTLFAGTGGFRHLDRV